jgi:hypothetical protein
MILMSKHFLKTLILFLGMIVIGLLGIFLVNHYGFRSPDTATGASVAK